MPVSPDRVLTMQLTVDLDSRMCQRHRAASCHRACGSKHGPGKRIFVWRRAKMGRAPKPAPRWVGNIIARVLQAVGPTGLEFGRYSIGAPLPFWL